MESKIVKIKLDRTIIIYFKDFFDSIRKSWVAIRSHAHHFVFSFVDFKAKICSKDTVEEPQRVGEPQFFIDIYCVPRTHTPTCDCPLADAVKCQNRSLFERRRVKCGCCVTYVVVAEINFVGAYFQMVCY